MYHIELRQFPNHACHFNLSEQQLHAIIHPWARQQIIEVGERKWAPERATLTVLEGPALQVQQLAMGRGWRAAQRSGQDVTERVLAAAAAAQAAQVAAAAGAAPAAPGFPPATTSPVTATPSPAPATPSPAPARPSPAAVAPAPTDPLTLAVQLASLLGGEPERLLAAWREVAARSSGLAPSEALALAERQLAGPGADPG